jgi:anti-sigma factor RsiW
MSDSIAPLNLTDDADRWLDRLADGELNPDQQRRLLAALETHPDGWRRCALTFVEAQTLRAEFRRMTTADNVAVPQRGDPKQPTMTVRQPARPNSALAPARWLAIAASLLVAFTLGITAQGWWPATALPDHAEQIASVQPAQPTAAPTENPPVASDNSIPTSSTAASPASGKWQALKVTIPTADGQGEQTVEVPLVAAGEQELKTLLAKQEPVLSDVALQALQSTGHEVQQRRAYYPVQLADGTQAILPMDYVEVRDTGNWQ